ncbi:MAG TPA: sigma-54-dependent Fis family transcriptional regulator, partial [Candidatus Aenigmarchaeota archaeon]|nr:sigma-54-dependent Fis family transcriptional regulator [Candidatus Aenigmarchaeota archaeon]
SFTNAYQRRLGKFETANSGTLFLDEIADLSPELQPKILRAIEYKSFERIGGNEMIHSDVRVIAATSKDLEKLVEEDKFRPELYDRLNVIPIYIPPLRDRKDDIPLLIEYFMKALGSSKKIKGDVLKQFLLYDWPGNVRELKCVVERLVIMSEGDEITLYDVEKYWKKCDYTCDNSTHTNHLEDEMKCMFLPQTIAKIANCKLESILKIGRKKWPEIKYYVSGDGLHLIHIDDAIEFFKATDKPEMAERLRRYREEI